MCARMQGAQTVAPTNAARAFLEGGIGSLVEWEGLGGTRVCAPARGEIRHSIPTRSFCTGKTRRLVMDGFRGAPSLSRPRQGGAPPCLLRRRPHRLPHPLDALQNRGKPRLSGLALAYSFFQIRKSHGALRLLSNFFQERLHLGKNKHHLVAHARR